MFIMALDIGAFVGRDQFRDEMQSFVQFLKSARLAPGFDEILMPGEMEARMRQAERSAWREI